MFYSLQWILTMLCGFCLADPPQKPGNISCVYYDNYTLTCSWTPVREINSETNYTLIKTDRPINASDELDSHTGSIQDAAGRQKTCKSKSGSCSLYDIASLPFWVKVKAENQFGTEESDYVLQQPWEILKSDPPQISKLEPSPGKKQMLRVSWKKPSWMPKTEDSKCQIHYSSVTKNHSNTTTVSMKTRTEDHFFNIHDLWDFANYTVVLRCVLVVSKCWSEWSSEEMGTTEEQAPWRVDLWRIIEPHQPTGTRTVHLLWKENTGFPSSGIINGYEIRYFAESYPYFKNVTDPSKKTVTLNLTGEAYEIRVVAYNSAGYSPEAILTIPSIHEESMDHQRIVTLKAFALKEHMFLEWQPSDLEINGYIIEWYDALETEVDKRSWQKITNVTSWASPKGAFRPFRYYNISVYPLLKGEIKYPSSIEAYFHDGIPPVLSAKAENVDKNEATIKWEDIPKAERNGSFISYTVFYKAEGGEIQGETVNGSVLQYRLESLQPYTKYTAWVMASTIVGRRNGTKTTFVTKRLSAVDIIVVCVVVGMFMLCLLTVGMLWALKRHTLKRICWPDIPHPVITSCPDLSSQEAKLSKSSFGDDTVISTFDVGVCSEDHVELELLNREDCSKQTNTPVKDMVGSHDILCSENEVMKPFLQASSLEHDLWSQALPALKVDFRNYENKEVQDQSNMKNVGIQDLSKLNEKTDFNPYLKNSVHTRMFLVCENSDQSTKRTKTQPRPLASCLPTCAEQAYVALDTFELFSNSNKLQRT